MAMYCRNLTSKTVHMHISSPYDETQRYSKNSRPRKVAPQIVTHRWVIDKSGRVCRCDSQSSHTTPATPILALSHPHGCSTPTTAPAILHRSAVKMKCWNQEFTLDFIDLLRSLTYLWDMQNSEYRSAAARKRGYGLLVQKAREVDPDATIDDVKRKIKGLRTNLKKTERRVLSYRRCGLEHTPSLFYYEPLSFLLTQDTGRSNRQGQSIISAESRASSDAGSAEEEAGQDGREAAVRMRSNEIMDCDVFGQYVAAKLISISKLQRVYLEKIINDAIFQAELGNLSPTTRLYKEEHFSNSEHTFIVDLSSNNSVQRIPNDVVVMEEVQKDDDVVLQEVEVEHNKDSQCENGDSQFENADSQYENADSQYENADSQYDNEDSQYENGDNPQYENGDSQNAYEDSQNENEQQYQIVTSGYENQTGSNVKVEHVEVHDSWGEPEQILPDSDRMDVERPATEQANTVTLQTAQNGALEVIPTPKVRKEIFFKINQSVGHGASGECAPGSVISLKNVEFADDDLMKMCADDGITIICVEDPMDQSSRASEAKVKIVHST